jgi:hypothetical protein
VAASLTALSLEKPHGPADGNRRKGYPPTPWATCRIVKAAAEISAQSGAAKTL